MLLMCCLLNSPLCSAFVSMAAVHSVLSRDTFDERPVVRSSGKFLHPTSMLWAGLVSQEVQVVSRLTPALVSVNVRAQTCDRLGKSVVITHTASNVKWVRLVHHYQTVASYQVASFFFPLICIVTHLILHFTSFDVMFPHWRTAALGKLEFQNRFLKTTIYW